MKRMLWMMVLTGMALPVAAYGQVNPYAEDMLRGQRERAAIPGCPPRDALRSLGAPVMNEGDADALLCHAAQELPLALQVREYGCADRSELVIGMLLYWGVPYEALGRVSTFHDRTRNGGGREVFTLDDPAHGRPFSRAWQLVFGNAFPQRLELRMDKDTTLLDVDGTIRWNIGHIAPTVWVRGQGGRPELRVLDPVLGPDGALTPEEWRKRQNAAAAAMLWGGLGGPPDILAEYLSGPMLERLRREFTIPAHEPLDIGQLNTLLRGMPPDMKATAYARILDIDAKAAWHPSRWAGYSLTGDGLPDWRPDDGALAQRRFDAARRRLAPLLAYEGMRKRYKDDEAFLNAVRDRIKRGKDGPKVIYIDFTEEWQ